MAHSQLTNEQQSVDSPWRRAVLHSYPLGLFMDGRICNWKGTLSAQLTIQSMILMLVSIYFLLPPFLSLSTEEVLNSDHALWFSPDSRYLAYVQFNDTSVNWYQFPWYGDRKNAYTSLRQIAYPKPGYSNPTVKVFVVDLQAQKRIELPEPASFMNM